MQVNKMHHARSYSSLKIDLILKLDARSEQRSQMERDMETQRLQQRIQITIQRLTPISHFFIPTSSEEVTILDLGCSIHRCG